MPKYNRTIFKIFDLPPKNISKIFSFVHHFYNEESLKLSYFKESLKQFSIQEQNFICLCCINYFDLTRKSFLKSEIIRFENDFDFDMASEYVKTLTDNAESLLTYINNVLLKTLERQHGLIKRRALITDFAKTVDLTKDDFRLPLYSKNIEIKFSKEPNLVRKLVSEEVIDYLIAQKIDPKVKLKAEDFVGFKKQFFEILMSEFDNNQISQIFNNSFNFDGNSDDAKLLNIEFINSTKIYNCFYQIFCIYNNFQNNLVAGIQEINFTYSEKSRTRSRFEKKIKKINAATKVDFMRIMYYNFPQIRDSFILYKSKNPHASLKKYLTTKSRNIR